MPDLRKLLLTVTLALPFAAPGLAQQQHPASQADHHSSDATQEDSGIAALSREEKEDLLAGAGMGLARPAELNQHPGPKHVLELARELALSDKQRAEIERLRSEVVADARRLGREIVDEEEHLDRRFEHRHVDPDTLRSVTARIADLYGELRFVHLRAHLATREILTAEQILAYDRLRGYVPAPNPERDAVSADIAAAEAALGEAERAFAAAAAERDRAGFSSFLTPQTVFATPHGNLRGPAAILEQWDGFFQPEGPSITWEPALVAVIEGAGIGLSSGPFRIEAQKPDGSTARFRGTFFSVWRQDAEGKWKILLDTGTEAQPDE